MAGQIFLGNDKIDFIQQKTLELHSDIWIWIYSDGYDDTKMKLSGKFYYNKVSSIQWKFKAQRNAKISWKAQKGAQKAPVEI